MLSLLLLSIVGVCQTINGQTVVNSESTFFMCKLIIIKCELVAHETICEIQIQEQ